MQAASTDPYDKITPYRLRGLILHKPSYIHTNAYEVTYMVTADPAKNSDVPD